MSRSLTLTRWTSIALLAGGFLALGRALPLETAFMHLATFSEGAGLEGLALLGLAYVVAVLLFVPGSAITVTLGALVGLVRGVVLVSLASTTAAALAFLVARHLARRRVERLARRYPRFRAVDRAIAEGGWRVVALLRLSPAVPYSAGNYLFGLTAVAFWPYVLASWTCMLPGTLLYVYLGYAGHAGLRGVAAGSARTPAEWALLAVGLAATAAVTVYLTRLARRTLERQGAVREEDTEPDGSGAETRESGGRWGTVALAVAAVLVAGGGILAQTQQATLAALFGPPPVHAEEIYAETPAGPRFDHSLFDAVLSAHVREGGFVDYQALRADPGQLDAYLQALARADFGALGRDEKLALLVNAYNAFTLRLILDHWPVDSIRDIPAKERWKDARWRIGSRRLSLDAIEHEEIRPRFEEPRIHFALVCAAVSCPPLRHEAYVGASRSSSPTRPATSTRTRAGCATTPRRARCS
jgi:uncharacterized membrane protein YdjX (TVP38/TMEM64 family)